MTRSVILMVSDYGCHTAMQYRGEQTLGLYSSGNYVSSGTHIYVVLPVFVPFCGVL